MTLREAAQRLKVLGFQFFEQGGIRWGAMAAEDFDPGRCHVLSEPFRDVFIGECKGGWYITSHINFSAQRCHSQDKHTATILNIFGSGKTLEHALEEFEHNFENKTYNGS